MSRPLSKSALLRKIDDFFSHLQNRLRRFDPRRGDDLYKNVEKKGDFDERMRFRKRSSNRLYLLCLGLCLVAACHRVPDQIEPTLKHTVQDRYLRSLPSPFPPLDSEERAQDWGREMTIGHAFAHQLDLYQAITAFRRAQILLPPQNKPRLLEIEYEILLCYYVGQKWADVIYAFENCDLKTADTSFPALHDLLLILYDAYQHEHDDRGTRHIFQLIQHYFPEEAQNLTLSYALTTANLQALEVIEKTPPKRPYLTHFLADYHTQKKSIGRAQGLNALLPGAGYFYLGQKQSGVTALLVNGLFIASSVYFFETGNIAAGAIFTSFEAGWYFGGIYGAGLEAKYYNERLYERLATPMMTQERLFPILLLNYGF